MRPSASYVIALLARHSVSVHNRYAACLQDLDWGSFDAAVGALERTTRHVVNDDGYLAQVLYEHAQSELAGAEVIRMVGASVYEPTIRELLRRHAADEERHSRIFHALSRLILKLSSGDSIYPAKIHDRFLDEYSGDVHSFVCDTHFAEIRNIFYLVSLRSAISSADPHAAKKMYAGLSRIIVDEERHVASTGFIINELFDLDCHMDERLSGAFSDYKKFIELEAEERHTKGLQFTKRVRPKVL